MQREPEKREDKKKGRWETCFLKSCDWKWQSASLLCSITTPCWKSTETMKKEHFSSAVEMGLPPALLNFRLYLCSVRELLWVCRRPAGLLSHQSRWFLLGARSDLLAYAFCSTSPCKIWPQVADYRQHSHHRHTAVCFPYNKCSSPEQREAESQSRNKTGVSNNYETNKVHPTFVPYLPLYKALVFIFLKNNRAVSYIWIIFCCVYWCWSEFKKYTVKMSVCFFSFFTFCNQVWVFLWIG